jgi:hypothetical protein
MCGPDLSLPDLSLSHRQDLIDFGIKQQISDNISAALHIHIQDKELLGPTRCDKTSAEGKA